MNDNANADMVEVFSSIQGEGMLVGLRQLFLRFHGCNLDCAYCDTAAAIDKRSPRFCRMEKNPGRRDFVHVENPVALDCLLALIDGWKAQWPGVHHSISLTGGEPLLRVDILRHWLPGLRSRLPVYLETNGVLHQELASIIAFVDFIGMDIKLPSTSGYTDLWEEHQSFLRIAGQKNMFVKIVIDKETEDREISRAGEIIASVNREIPLILQPRTLANGTIGISTVRSLELQEIAAKIVMETRIIPQTHVFSGYL